MSFLDNTGLAYFYSKLKEKFIRSVTAGNDVLTPDASGNVNIVNVPTASNLTSPDAQTSYGTFVYRTSGGSASLTSGDAQLMYVDGNMEIVGRKVENFDITATNQIIISYDAAVWRLTIDSDGTYYFRYAQPTSSQPTSAWSGTGSWTRDGVGSVILSDYGLSASGIVDPSISASVSGSGVTGATVVPSTFITAVSTDGTYEFVYSTTQNGWIYNEEKVTLSDYGISATGTPNNNDVITISLIVGTPDSVVTIVYTAPAQGTIYVPQPTGFSATGFNQFNKGDSTSYLTDATFANGTIESGDHIVAFCRAKGGVDNGYVAYSEGEYIVGIGWCADVPESGSTIVTTDASVAPSLASIPFDDDGYVAIEVTSVEDLCVHPKWSGSADTDYADYVAPSVIEFPMEDVEENDLPLKTYGMPRVGSVPDTLDLDAGIYIQRVGRVVNTPANMSMVIGLDVDYDYDDSWIYYVLPTPITFSIDVSPDYIVNDWGTEEFLDTDIACTAQMLYNQNLRDKLRTDVVTISEQSLTQNQKNQVCTNIGAFNKAGDTITGTLKTRSSTIDTDVTPSALTWGAGQIQLNDKDDDYIGVISPAKTVQNQQGLIIGGRRLVNGNTINNLLYLYVDGSGNQAVYVSNAPAWRNGLGLDELAMLDRKTSITTEPSSINVLMDYKPGAYRVSVSGTQIFPYSYGILEVIKAADYGLLRFTRVNSSTAQIWIRTFNTNNKTMYDNDWRVV